MILRVLSLCIPIFLVLGCVRLLRSFGGDRTRDIADRLRSYLDRLDCWSRAHIVDALRSFASQYSVCPKLLGDMHA